MEPLFPGLRMDGLRCWTRGHWTCVVFINQIADYNAGARNVGEVCVINEVLGGRPR
jgi:hypothetical protein